MNKRAQTTLEACVLIALVAAAFLAMHGYLKRAIQGNWKQNTDSFSEGQFEPGISTEHASNNLMFRGSTIHADLLNPDGTTNTTTDFNVASRLGGNVQVQGWGTYYDDAEHD